MVSRQEFRPTYLLAAVAAQLGHTTALDLVPSKPETMVVPVVAQVVMVTLQVVLV